MYTRVCERREVWPKWWVHCWVACLEYTWRSWADRGPLKEHSCLPGGPQNNSDTSTELLIHDNHNCVTLVTQFTSQTHTLYDTLCAHHVYQLASELQWPREITHRYYREEIIIREMQCYRFTYTYKVNYKMKCKSSLVWYDIIIIINLLPLGSLPPGKHLVALCTTVSLEFRGPPKTCAQQNDMTRQCPQGTRSLQV